MRKLLYLFVLVAGIANAQIVNIPDANFKVKLLEADTSNEIAQNAEGLNIKIDADSDGEIQLSEALQVAYLDVSNSNISDLTGIASFTNLQELMCHTNPLTSLDTSGLNNLTYLNCSFTNISNLQVNGSPNLNRLYCYYSNLSTLDVSQLSNLTDLQCHANHFTSLNVSALVNLQILVIQSNPLTSIDLSNQSNLIELAATGCNFSSLDLSGCTNLRFLTAHDNGLTSLNISGLSHLTALECANNNLSNLDFSSATDLTFVNLENNTLQQLDLSHNPLLENLNISLNLIITYVNLKNGGNSSEFSLGACPSLHYVCADEGEIDAINASNASFSITDIEVNSYCSFTPGGNYNTISGTVRFDADGNGCDANDSAQPLVRMNMAGPNANGATFSNLEGNYVFYTGAGSFDWFPDIENATWFNVTPTTGTTTFSNNNGNIAQQDFCLSANGNHPDVEIVIAPRMPARPGFDAVYKVVYKNKGNRALSGNLIFSYDDAVLDFVSSTVSPNSQAIGELSFSYTNLLPFENRSFYITLNVNGPMGIPPVNIGDVLNFTATISPGEGDENPSDNQFQYHQTVVGSFDPNDIICIEGNIVSPSEIGNYLHYVINFENTGNAEAENIVVREVIDVSQFDVNSLQLMNSSSPVTARLTGNVAEFIFSSIHLEAGGHGNILLKMKTKNTLVEGDSVSKKVNIYFDYNFPVETLPENTLFQALSNPDIDIDASISIYPNPSKGMVHINCASTIKSVQMYDIQGRLLQTNLVNKNQTDFDISNQSSGVYFLKVISENGIGVKKIVRE